MEQSATKKSGTQRHRADTKARKRFAFCLAFRKRMERDVGQGIENLKRQRQFKQTVLYGIMLIASLREHNTDVLDALFPHVRAQIRREEQERLRAEIASEQFNALLHEFADLKARQQPAPPRLPDPAPTKPTALTVTEAP